MPGTDAGCSERNGRSMMKLKEKKAENKKKNEEKKRLKAEKREEKLNKKINEIEEKTADSNISKAIEKKSNSKKTTIRMRIVRLGIISAASAAVLCSAFSMVMNYNTLTTNAENELSNLATAYSSAISNADIVGNKNFINGLFDKFNKNGQESGEGSFGFVINGANSVFSEFENGLIYKGLNFDTVAEDKAYSDISAKIKTAQEEDADGIVTTKLDNQMYYMAYSPVKGYDGFFTVVMYPEKTIKAPFVRELIINVLAAVLVIAVTLGFCLKVATMISGPINQVSDRLVKLSQGDLESPTPEIYRSDETQVLVDSLTNTVNSLREYIRDIQTVLSGVASGNLLINSSTEYKGDFVSIRESLDSILDSLNETFGDVDRAAGQVRDCSSQVAGGATTLSQNASNEAATIEELTASIHEISGKVSGNADMALKARKLTQEADQKVSQGSSDMSEMLTAIGDIKKSSAEISKIIAVIDDIAFQTNILALNAAVEAARAGSAGKGFAVVADEVRNLATKSAEAANQTGQLISRSLESVEQGTQLAEKASQALEEVVEKVRSVNDIVDNIAVSAGEQAKAVSQINEGMDLINGSIQTTSSTAQESAAASEELSGQSDLLNSMINKFSFRRK